MVSKLESPGILGRIKHAGGSPASVRARAPTRAVNSRVPQAMISWAFCGKAYRRKAVSIIGTRARALKGHMSAIGTGIPRLIIRLTRRLSGREPEFARVGEDGRVRLWANTWARPDRRNSGPRAGWIGRRRCGRCCRGARLRPQCLPSQAARSAVAVKSRGACRAAALRPVGLAGGSRPGQV